MFATSTTSPPAASSVSASPRTATSRSVARSRATTRAPSYVGVSSQRSPARTLACSPRGRHEAGGAAGVLGAVAERVERPGSVTLASRSSTTIPRSHLEPRPAGTARVDGRPPAVSTTRSVVEGEAVVEAQRGSAGPFDEGGRRGHRCRRRPRAASGPGRGSWRPGRSAAGGAGGRPPSTTSVARPRVPRARCDLEAEQTAADDDRTPTVPGRARSSRSQSASERKACTASCSEPSIRTRPRIGWPATGCLPVASTSRSYSHQGAVDEHHVPALPVDAQHPGRRGVGRRRGRRTTAGGAA